jgi:hypothetical protein
LAAASVGCTITVVPDSLVTVVVTVVISSLGLGASLGKPPLPRIPLSPLGAPLPPLGAPVPLAAIKDGIPPLPPLAAINGGTIPPLAAIKGGTIPPLPLVTIGAGTPRPLATINGGITDPPLGALIGLSRAGGDLDLDRLRSTGAEAPHSLDGGDLDLDLSKVLGCLSRGGGELGLGLSYLLGSLAGRTELLPETEYGGPVYSVEERLLPMGNDLTIVKCPVPFVGLVIKWMSVTLNSKGAHFLWYSSTLSLIDLFMC